jgi:hypothetical protein
MPAERYPPRFGANGGSNTGSNREEIQTLTATQSSTQRNRASSPKFGRANSGPQGRGYDSCGPTELTDWATNLWRAPLVS